jgi:hypothetical protein
MFGLDFYTLYIDIIYYFFILLNIVIAFSLLRLFYREYKYKQERNKNVRTKRQI